MNEHFTVAAWFLALAPLTFSPGPANVMLAAMGAAFGLRATLPFLLGTNVICVLQSVLIGFGITIVVSESEWATVALKWAGVLALLFLSIRFFRSKVASGAASEPLGFKEGVLLQVLNGKFLLIPTLMFSLFYNFEASGVAAVLGFTGALALLTLSANLLWVTGGKALAAVLQEAWFVRYQGVFFGSILLGTSVWIAMN